jgi:hypothetical protein
MVLQVPRVDGLDRLRAVADDLDAREQVDDLVLEVLVARNHVPFKVGDLRNVREGKS